MILGRLNRKIIFPLIPFVIKIIYPIYVSNKTFENCMNLLLITIEYKSHYICIKKFNKFMCNKTKITILKILSTMW